MSEADDMQRVQAIARRRKAGLLDKGVDRILRLLDAARQEIVAEVASSDWDRFILPRLLRNVQAALDTWRAKALGELEAGQTAGWTAGAETAAASMEALGIDVALPTLPDSLLQALERRGAAAVTGLASFGRQQLDQTIAGSLLSGGDRESAIEAIGQVLKKADVFGKPQGRFATLRARAEFIYRHEVGAAFAAAKDLRDEQTMRYAPELKKIWRHAGHPAVPRTDHIAMHGQERSAGEPFVNPITGAELAYPRDPDADIAETANCTCDTVLWRELYGDKQEFIGAATTAARKAA